MNFRSECDYFAVAIDMLFKFKRRADNLGLFASIDFSEIDIVPWRDRVDVRDKRLHVTEYFKPGGKSGRGWFFETPDFKADASSTIGTLIGGRLDWAALGRRPSASCRNCSRSQSRIRRSREHRGRSPLCQSASLALCAQWLGTTNEWPSNGWSS